MPPFPGWGLGKVPPAWEIRQHVPSTLKWGLTGTIKD